MELKIPTPTLKTLDWMSQDDIKTLINKYGLDARAWMTERKIQLVARDTIKINKEDKKTSNYKCKSRMVMPQTSQVLLEAFARKYALTSTDEMSATRSDIVKFTGILLTQVELTKLMDNINIFSQEGDNVKDSSTPLSGKEVIARLKEERGMGTAPEVKSLSPFQRTQMMHKVMSDSESTDAKDIIEELYDAGYPVKPFTIKSVRKRLKDLSKGMGETKETLSSFVHKNIHLGYKEIYNLAKGAGFGCKLHSVEVLFYRFRKKSIAQEENPPVIVGVEIPKDGGIIRCRSCRSPLEVEDNNVIACKKCAKKDALSKKIGQMSAYQKGVQDVSDAYGLGLTPEENLDV